MDFEVTAETELADNPEVQQKNGLLYVMPQSLSSSVNKTFIRQYAQRTQYGPGDTIVFDMNTGSRYIDPENCALMFTVSTTDGLPKVVDTTYTPFTDELGALSLINEIRVHAKSGVELERVQEVNQYAYLRAKLRENSDYWEKYASLWGGGRLKGVVADVPVNSQIGNTSTPTRILMPMKLLSGLFDPTVKGMKMPPGLLSGARIEISLENFGRAFDAAFNAQAGTSYVVNDPIITCMAHELTDSSQRVLNEESVENGLEYTYTRVFTAAEASASDTINIQVKKAVSQGLRAFAAPIPTATLNAQGPDSFISNINGYSNWQYRIGSNFYPQQRVDSTVEGYYTTLNIYNKNDTDGWFSNDLSYDEYLEDFSIMGAGFETDSRLNLTGVPINNSATLELQTNVTAAEEYKWFVFLEYVAVARSFLTNVDVKI